MSYNWEFSLYLQVRDPEQLLAAALAHEDGLDYTREDLLDADGEIDIGHCLLILLDPGHLPGCNILDSATGGS